MLDDRGIAFRHEVSRATIAIAQSTPARTEGAHVSTSAGLLPGPNVRKNVGAVLFQRMGTPGNCFDACQDVHLGLIPREDIPDRNSGTGLAILPPGVVVRGGPEFFVRQIARQSTRQIKTPACSAVRSKWSERLRLAVARPRLAQIFCGSKDPAKDDADDGNH